MTTTRTTLVVGLAALLVVGVALPVAALVGPTAGGDGANAAAGAPADSTALGGTNGSAMPAGSRFAGAVSAQRASLHGELATRTLVVRLARADSDRERAAVLADLRARTDERLSTLADDRDRLRRLRDNESVSPGSYAHAAARVSVETTVTKRLSVRGERAARTLPPAVADRYDVRARAFAALANRSAAAETALTEVVGEPGANGSVDLPVEWNDSRPGAGRGTILDPSLDSGAVRDALNRTVDPENRTDWPFAGAGSPAAGLGGSVNGSGGFALQPDGADQAKSR
ncbi:MAG: hypothetical protein ABEJ31_13455 [Haloarculaceae archaeon]